MIYKYIKASIAFFILAGTTASALFGNDLGTLNEMEVRGSNNFEDLDLTRSTILSQDTLDSRQINSLENLNGLSPNLHLSGNGIKSFGDVITMRGIGNTQFFGSPGVQLYVDGLPQGNVFSYGSDLYDLEAVEVLKGPQGGRFGKLAPGGAINLITKKPGKTHTSKVSASYATFNTQKYNIATYGPLDEQFSYSLGVQRSLSDGFLNNISGRNNNSESWNGRLSFHWDGGAGTKAILGTSFTSHELGAQPLVLRGIFSTPNDFYARTVNESNEFTEIDQNQQYLKLEHELDWATFHSITTRNNWKMNPNLLDIDFMFGAFTSTINQDQEFWTQELRFDFVKTEEKEITAGLFYSDEDINGLASRFVGMNIDTTYTLENKNLGGYLFFSKLLNDKNQISLSARLDDFDKSIDRTNTMTVPIIDQKNFSVFSGNASWSHEISDSSKLNFLIGFANKPGGFSAFTNDIVQKDFDEEQILSYEANFKFAPTESWDLAFSAFLNDIEDYQFELNGVGMDYYLENADEVSIYGIEVDSTWNLGNGWLFGASYGFTESEFEKVSALPALVGKQLTFVPDQSISFILKHELDNGLSYQVGSRTVGKTFFWDNTGENSNDVIDPYTLLEAQIGYTFNDWKFNLWGTNLTDEEYHTSLVTNLGFGDGNNPGVVGSPRVIGISIAKDF
jgi:iron complex outermembrane receptor protein